MSCEIAVLPWWVLLLPFMGPATATAACGAAMLAGARRLQGAARWMRKNGLSADQLAFVPLAPVNLSQMEFRTLAQACDLRPADTVRDTSLDLTMTLIATTSGQNFGLIQVGNTFHLAGAADMLQAGVKVVPELAQFHQVVNTTATMKALATRLGADLSTIQVYRDQTGMLYADMNVLNPVEVYRPVEMTVPTPRVFDTGKHTGLTAAFSVYRPAVSISTPKSVDIGNLAVQIAAAEPMTGVQTYQAPPPGYLRVVMEVEPNGKMHVSVLGDHGEEEECRPVSEALQEAFQNAEVVCSLRSIGQAPPAPSGIAPLDKTLSADRSQVLSRPRQIQYGR